MMDCLLAHDIGTSGDKAVLLASDGSVLATAYSPYATHFPRPQWAEQNPEDWWHAIIITTKRVMEIGNVTPQQIKGIAFSSQMLNIVPVDRTGNPLSPCISWLDGRADEEALWVMKRLGGSDIFSMIVGSKLTGKDVLPKHLWLKRHCTEIYNKAVGLLDVGSYVLLRTTGKMVCEWSLASVTGLFNQKTKNWDYGLIRIFGLDQEKFLPLVQSKEKVGGLMESPARELGLLAGTPVFGGAGDAMSTALGSGAVGDQDGHLCLGTSGYVAITTSRNLPGKKGIVTLQSADPDRLLMIAEMETAGACIKWAARELYGVEPTDEILARMDADVSNTSPGSGGLIFSPWMYGERCPVADEHVRASFINLSANHSRAQMTRAIYEGIAYNIRWILQLFSEKYQISLRTLRVVGGGARGLPWLRIISDVGNVKLESAQRPQESAALGAGLIALIGLGMCECFDDIKPLIGISNVIEPDQHAWEVYQPLYNVYREIYPSLRKIYYSLNKLNGKH